jgi:hypothetical protein
VIWESKGCAICRRQWETGEQPRRICISQERQAYLHLCEVCGSYWEQAERHAYTISEDDARSFYGTYFSR